MTTSELRVALGEDFLAGRPSYRKVVKRAERLGLDAELTRDKYTTLMAETREVVRMLAEAGVNPADFTIKHVKVGRWSKGNRSLSVQAVPREETPPGGDHRATARELAFNTSVSTGSIETICIPDAHIGWFRSGSTLEPIHDPAAIEVTIQAIEHFQPATVVILGDWLDFPGLSRFTNDPSYLNWASEAIQTTYDYLARIREAAPHAHIVFLEGNHELRLGTYLSSRGPEVSGLRRAGGESVTSIPHLLRLDELGITYVAPYTTHWWAGGVRFLHGELLGRRGSETVRKMLVEYPESSVCGHVHRLELAFRTLSGPLGPYTIWAMSCGTLARLDGVVPGSTYPDWQQGVGVIWAGGVPGVYLINEGTLTIDGLVFDARVA